MLGNCCIFRVVTDGRIRQNAFRFKLERRRKLQGTYIQDSRGSTGQKMQTRCPCFVWKRKLIISCHSWTNDPPAPHQKKREKIQVGIIQLHVSLFTLSRKKALCGSECSWDGTRKTRICLEILKMNYYIKQALNAPGARECMSMFDGWLYTIK